MKSYNHLWEKLISDENILLAIRNASKGNMKREMLTYLKYHAKESIPMIRNWIEEYEPHPHKVKIINDGISAKICVKLAKLLRSQNRLYMMPDKC